MNNVGCVQQDNIGSFLEKMGMLLFDEMFPPSEVDSGMDIVKNLTENKTNKQEVLSNEILAYYLVQKNIISYSINYDKIKHCCSLTLKKLLEVDDNDAVLILMDEFKDFVAKLVEFINIPEVIDLKKIPIENEMFFLDAKFFDFMLKNFSTITDYKSYISVKIKESKARSKSSKNILSLLESLWSPSEKFENIPVFSIELARRIWELSAKKRWKRKLLNKPALPLTVNQCIIETIWTPDNKIKEINDKRLIATPSGRTVALITEETLLNIEEIQKRHGLLGTLTGHKMIRHFAYEYHSRFFNSDNREPGRLEFEGGRENLARVLKIKSDKLIKQIPDILTAGQNFSMKLSDGTFIGGLWSFLETKGVGRSNKSHLWVTLGEALRPHYMYNLKKHQQILIPIVPIPTLVNPNNYYGQQASAQFLVVQRIVSDRKFLRTYGGGLFTTDILKEIASQVGLPIGVMMRAWEAWQIDSDDCDAFLEKVDKDVYQIAKNKTFKESRECIEHLIFQSNNGFERATKRINKKLKK